MKEDGHKTYSDDNTSKRIWLGRNQALRLLKVKQKYLQLKKTKNTEKNKMDSDNTLLL